MVYNQRHESTFYCKTCKDPRYALCVHVHAEIGCSTGVTIITVVKLSFVMVRRLDLWTPEDLRRLAGGDTGLPPRSM